MINIIIGSILVIIAIICLILSYRSANKISKIPHTRREVAQATALTTESIVYAISWATGMILATIILLG
jgi:hypothetical protein